MTRIPAERIWQAQDPASRATVALLAPASWLYGAAVAVRNRLYDSGRLRMSALPLPAVSVGNLTVGGTGKTPFAAWLAGRLIASGAKPGILLRGYGQDEPDVHRHLNPGALVVSGADRLASAVVARDRGATVLVLDDAFQHRRVARDADVVLLSADRHAGVRLLPAGPWREPLSALKRATHIVVTRKSASPMRAREVEAFARRLAPHAPVAVAFLTSQSIVRWGDGYIQPLSVLAGRKVLAAVGVADPRSVDAQLRHAGARATLRAYPDHYAFPGPEIAALARGAGEADYFVCTLKDAVKLGPAWPPSAPPIWYLSQRMSVEAGADVLDALVSRLATLASAIASSRRPEPAKDPNP